MNSFVENCLFSFLVVRIVAVLRAVINGNSRVPFAGTVRDRVVSSGIPENWEILGNFEVREKLITLRDNY